MNFKKFESGTPWLEDCTIPLPHHVDVEKLDKLCAKLVAKSLGMVFE